MADSRTDDVLAEVRAERERQDGKWGQQNHEPFLWLAILGEEFGESQKAALDARIGAQTGKATLEDLREELIQTAAVAVAFVECLDRNRAALRRVYVG